MRRLLLAVALSGDLRTAELAAIADPGAVEDAVDAGLLLVDGDRVRASHPLLAAAARKRSRAARAARAAPRAGRRRSPTRSCARCTSRSRRQRPDAALAATVAARRRGARRRAAPAQEAVRLAEHALRLTPPDVARARRAPARARRATSRSPGEPQRVTDLLHAGARLAAAAARRGRAPGCCSAEGGAIARLRRLRAPPRARAGRERGRPGAARATCWPSWRSTAPPARVERIRRGGGAGRWRRCRRRAAPAPRRRAARARTRWRWARSLRGRPVDDAVRALPRRVGRRVLHRRLARAGRRPAARLARRAEPGAGDA